MLRQSDRGRWYVLAEIALGCALFGAFWAPVAQAQTSTQLNQIYTAVIALKNAVSQQQLALAQQQQTLFDMQGALSQLRSQMTRVQKELTTSYFVTYGLYDGASARSACGNGFHMASLWEIFDTTGLRYESFDAATLEDAGSGPPTDLFGWVRTGRAPFSEELAGEANCDAWSTSDAGKWGTLAGLHRHWNDSEFRPIDPWTAITIACDQRRRVWCVED